MMDMMTGGMAGMAGWILPWTLLTVGLLAIGIGWLVHQRPRPTVRPPVSDEPLEILRRRYATGDIDEDEYLQRLSGLSQR